MGFMNHLEKQLKCETQVTENGAVGYKTSGKKLLDLNFAVGSMRNWKNDRIETCFAKTYYENPLLAVKWLFYARDIRGNGMGERHVFRICFKWLVENHFYYVMKVIALIPEYGRFDDWVCLLDTKAKNLVLVEIEEQLEADICAMNEGKEISLLAKWLPSSNTSSATSRAAADVICQGLGFTKKEYRKTLSALRAYLQVTEVKMTAGKWKEIDYSKVPSRANLIYGKAFLKNDKERRYDFLNKLNCGEIKINADTLFPSDIVNKYHNKTGAWGKASLQEKDDTLEGLWKALPNYVKEDSLTLVVRDGSGSMTCDIRNTDATPLDVSTALAIYFAEHCKGQYFNKFITFSSEPQMIDLSNAACLRDKLEICYTYCDCTNTDIKAVFELILDTALENKLAQEELPKNILIVSDMEFDHAMCLEYYGSRKKSLNVLFEQIKAEYKEHGYQMPRLVFWNVCSRSNTIPLQENKSGVVLVSGFSPAVYQMVLSDELDPYKCLLEQINSERYDAVERALTQ